MKSITPFKENRSPYQEGREQCEDWPSVADPRKIRFLCTLYSVSSLLVLNLAFAPSLVYMGHLLKLKQAFETLECAYFSFNECSL